MVRKGGYGARLLLFFPVFMVKLNSLKHKGKQRLFFGILNFADSNGKFYLPMALKNGRKW
jgi:hypothetical protein